MVAPELGAARPLHAEPADDQLAGRLGAARDDGFVGRGRELDLLSAALTGSSDVRVMFVHGPGGIGKTTLLDAMARLTRGGGQRVTHLDARDVECSPAAVLAAVQERTVDEPAAVLLVDGYELLTPLDRWFRTQFLPARPAGAVTVVAGREAPAAAWWLDPGWRRLVSVHRLDELDDPDSRDLLLGLGVTDQVGRLAQLGRGYPLALAMLAEVDRSGRKPDQLSDAPDAVGQLCALILDDVPDEAHRTGLATCAHATRTTQDLLSRMIGPRASEVWAWLESRPYVRRGALGLYVHDVVRELFEAELAHRSPTEYVQLHRAVRGYFLDRMADPGEPHPDRAAAEVLLLHRKTPLAAQTSLLRDRGQLSVPRAGPVEREEIVALIQTNEGPQSAALARRWLAAQPRSAYHGRADTGTAAFALQVYLPGPDDLMADDPVAAAIWQLVSERGPLRPGERVNVNRFSGATTRYQGDPLQLLVNGVSCILEWATTPAAWTFITSVGGDHYGAYFDYLGLTPMLEVDLGEQTIIAFGWDRRQFPASAFFEMMATRELTGETGAPPAALMRPLPLTRTAFDAAVRAALRRLTRAGGLDGSELLTSALVPTDTTDTTDPPAALAGVLREAIVELARERGGAEHRRVLERTFLAGAPSQEAAAELLELPFSTYRRHLARATDRLVEVLWAIELDPDGPRRT
ncbi:MAG TPA: ATP-binding protein [Microlunatus sp.]